MFFKIEMFVLSYLGTKIWTYQKYEEKTSPPNLPTREIITVMLVIFYVYEHRCSYEENTHIVRDLGETMSIQAHK